MSVGSDLASPPVREQAINNDDQTLLGAVTPR
jgi:hypothetical protein